VLPADPFGRTHPPTREGRIAALLVTIDDLARDERPGHRMLGYALREWLLADCRSLEAALGVAAPRGSHDTPQALARKVRTGS
jgi:hypothetical protein